jgi:hypothetical protein
VITVMCDRPDRPSSNGDNGKRQRPGVGVL